MKSSTIFAITFSIVFVVLGGLGALAIAFFPAMPADSAFVYGVFSLLLGQVLSIIAIEALLK